LRLHLPSVLHLVFDFSLLCFFHSQAISRFLSVTASFRFHESNMSLWIKQSMFWKKKGGGAESRYDLLQKDDESGEASFSGSSIDVSLISEQMVTNAQSSCTISKGLAFFIFGLLGAVIVTILFLLGNQIAWHPKSPVPDCKLLVDTQLASID
jgi:hypothetical protein